MATVEATRPWLFLQEGTSIFYGDASNLCDSEDYSRSIDRASYATLSPKDSCLETRTNCSAQTYQHEIFAIPQYWEFH